MMKAQVTPGPTEQLSRRDQRWLRILGRLKPGVTQAQAGADFNTLAHRLEQAYPESNRNRSVAITAGNVMDPVLRAIIAAFLAILTGIVTMVLLAACTNVAALLLAKASARRKEIVIRLSIGAGRFRLVRQLLTESLLVSAIGGGLGLIVAFWARRLISRIAPPAGLPVTLNLAIDARILLYTLAVTAVTGVLFGIASALQASRSDLVSALKDEAGARGGKSRLRNLFVIAQVALSLLPLIGAGLLVRSLRNAHNIDPGFAASNLMVLSLQPQLAGYDQVKGRLLHDELVRRVEALPGVMSAVVAAYVPLADRGSDPAHVYVDRHEGPRAQWNAVGPGYFATMGIPSSRAANSAPTTD